ncbi:MAG TPA: hypothetical protein VK589_08070 [Chryseolinea sp.]|nr:hypothetical protein [Chryseolinea sp.]
MHKDWIIGVGAATFILGFIGYSWHVSNQYKEIRQKGKKTVGLITVFGSDIFCAFKIDGSETTKRMSKPHESMRDGERYQVYYYSPIPDLFYIDFSEPVIDSLSFKKTVTTEVQPGGDYLFLDIELEIKAMRGIKK